MPRMPRYNSGETIIYCANSSNNIQQDAKIKALEKKLEDSIAALSHDIEEKTTMGEDFVVNTDVGHIKTNTQVGRMESAKNLLKQMLYNPTSNEEVTVYFYDGEKPLEV